MTKSLVLVSTIVAAFALSACQSNQSGVKTNYHSQWTNVGANVKDTTEAARAVLTDDGLTDVKANSTNVDGTASGKKADGTAVKVAVQKQSDTSSQVSVTVGTMGDPALGASIAK